MFGGEATEITTCWIVLEIVGMNLLGVLLLLWLLRTGGESRE